MAAEVIKTAILTEYNLEWVAAKTGRDKTELRERLIECRAQGRDCRIWLNLKEILASDT